MSFNRAVTYMVGFVCLLAGLVIAGTIELNKSEPNYQVAFARALTLTVNKEVKLDYQSGTDQTLDTIMGVDLPDVYEPAWLKSKRILINSQQTIWDEGHHIILEVDGKRHAQLTRCDIEPGSKKGCTIYSDGKLTIVWSFIWQIQMEGYQDELMVKSTKALPFLEMIQSYGTGPIQLVTHK